ncbi:MAG: hypothetical protein ACRDHP_07395 [Ktedonobacterales bacterium]
MSNPEETPFPPAAHRLGESASWVVGVIDNPDEAQRAKQAALDAGYTEQDVVLLHGSDAINLAQAKTQQNPVTRVYAWLARAITDPGTAEQEYVEEARQGHSLLSIRAEEPDEVDRAVQLLDRFHAHRVKHFGQWVLTDHRD